MHIDDEPVATAGAPTAALRSDVLSARSRMRTKYGSQLQIAALAGLLGEDETLRAMAVAQGPSQPDRLNHGLLGLTTQRLVFVPRSSAYEVLSTDLTTLGALMWHRGGRVGTLTLIGETSASFTELANADGRELMALAVQMHPHIKRVEPL